MSTPWAFIATFARDLASPTRQSDEAGRAPSAGAEPREDRWRSESRQRLNVSYAAIRGGGWVSAKSIEVAQGRTDTTGWSGR